MLPFVAEDQEAFTSARQAANAIGVTAMAVENWKRAGLIDASGPWAREELLTVKRSRAQGGGKLSAPHGTPSRWRAGCPCDACRAAHNEQTRGDVKKRRDARLDPIWFDLLSDIAAGTPFGEACERYGLTAGGVSSMANADRPRRLALDDALMKGRDPGLEHGTSVARSSNKCRCPECRPAR